MPTRKFEVIETEETPSSTSSSTTTMVKTRKSNAERGREFRAREKQRMQALFATIHGLRNELMDLENIKSLREEQLHNSLVRRNTSQGSIAKLIHAYFSLFAYGSPLDADQNPISAQRLQQQEAFVRTVIDPACELIDASGLLEQWRKYTAFHGSFHVDVRFIQVLGPEDRPHVRVGLDLTVTLSHATFQHIFPHIAAADRRMLEKYVGRVVVYQAVDTLVFSPEGRILYYGSDVDFVSSLMGAGLELVDIVKLMERARITDQACICVDDEPKPKTSNRFSLVDPSSSEETQDIEMQASSACRTSDRPAAATISSRRGDIAFILS